ncbi:MULTISPECIES: UDP-N-acetylmuramate dehydrogenase [unclassified Pseudoalteromonas]|uniref:UDP-N-acetylmuramate dehydrogenase n=1 Tax=unclassified Pseudoalteromonas TaxID=194690 RepID=UPI0030150115
MTSLQAYHTFSLPAQCASLITIKDAAQLKQLDYSQPFFILGEGSNTVFLQDYQGQVIRMALQGVAISERQGDYQVTVAAGENWHQLVLNLLQKGIAGLENLALIPGSVGAAPVQNIGAYGVEVAQFIDHVNGFDVISRQFQRLSASECQFGYRDSVFKQQLKDRFIITEVVFNFPKAWQPQLSYGPLQSLSPDATAAEICQAVMAIRRSKLPDPAELPNAGSFFKNPIVSAEQAKQLQAEYPNLPCYPADDAQIKLAAGWLIEQAGLKGTCCGDIRVYEKQALVLVHQGNSSGAELKRLVMRIQRQVWQQFAVRLEHEVRLIAAQGECHLNLDNQHENT